MLVDITAGTSTDLKIGSLFFGLECLTHERPAQPQMNGVVTNDALLQSGHDYKPR